MNCQTRNPIMLLALVALAVGGRASQVPASAAAEAPAVVSAVGEPAIIVLNYYYARPGQAEAVYRWRIHASDVREKLGLPRGRVLKRTRGPEASDAEDLPDVLWECEYPNAQARARDVARLSESAEFAAVETHMDTLIRQFRRELFRPEPAR